MRKTHIYVVFGAPNTTHIYSSEKYMWYIVTDYIDKGW